MVLSKYMGKYGCRLGHNRQARVVGALRLAICDLGFWLLARFEFYTIRYLHTAEAVRCWTS